MIPCRWKAFLRNAGIKQEFVEEYAQLFDKNRYVFLCMLNILIVLKYDCIEKYNLPSLIKKCCIGDSPRGWGIFFYFLQNISPYGGAFFTFGTLLKLIPTYIPGCGGGGGVGVYFDWCISTQPFVYKVGALSSGF